MTAAHSVAIDRTQQRLGPIWLTPGIGPRNVMALFYAGMMTIVFVTAMGILNPYLLNVHLEMDPDIQGNFMGNLTVIAEIVTMFVVVMAGTLSDRLGRRSLYVAGFLILGTILFFLPLVREPDVMIVLRVIMSAGFGVCLMMLASTIADYPQNPSRGKLISFNGVITGLGVLFIASLLFGRMPKLFADRGVDALSAGNYTFWILAIVALVSAIITCLGLKGGRTTSDRPREPYFQLLRTGMTEVRKNSRLVLTGFAYFVSRGDLLVLVTFMSMWIVNAGIAQGMTKPDAQATAGMLFGLSQLAMILFTPVMGLIIDRLDRVTALAIAMAIATVGYLALGLAGDPFGSWLIYPVIVLAGAGEAAVVVSGPALVGQEAPVRVRGSIVGLVGFCGTVGVLINAKIAGELFDLVSNQAPFTYMAVLNALVCIGAIGVRLYYGASRGAAAEQDAESTPLA